MSFGELMGNQLSKDTEVCHKSAWRKCEAAAFIFISILQILTLLLHPFQISIIKLRKAGYNRCLPIYHKLEWVQRCDNNTVVIMMEVPRFVICFP
jgi:hypothetical protein